jgi:DNA-binding GntR family transcriptional regulator
MTVSMSRATATRPRRPVLANEVYDAIKAMILDHRISPGQHIGIDELARELSVSQTPVREALARLESDQLVTKKPLRGYEATALLTIREFDDMFQFRSLIEPWAASEASRRATRRDLEALEAEIERAEHMERPASSSSYPAYADHDTRLHALVAHAAGNSVVEQAFIRTHCHLHLFRLYSASLSFEGDDDQYDGKFVREMFKEYYQGSQRPLALSEHREIVSAIAAGSSDSARELMLNHIESSRKRFIPAVEALNANR